MGMKSLAYMIHLIRHPARIHPGYPGTRSEFPESIRKHMPVADEFEIAKEIGVIE